MALSVEIIHFAQQCKRPQYHQVRHLAPLMIAVITTVTHLLPLGLYVEAKKLLGLAILLIHQMR